jgi:lia operon protein LiaG
MSNIKANVFNYDCSSGDFRAKGLSTGSSSVESTSGTINITDFTGDLKADSSSGDVSIDYANFDNNTDIHATSGNINLTLPKGSRFHLNATTSSGDISCDFPITITKNKKDNYLEGDVGSSGRVVRLDASSGDIKCLSK